MSIGENIKMLRKEKGLTQKELAKLSGLSEVSIINYEKGRRSPSAKILYQIANGLKVSIERLVGEDEAVFSDIHDIFSAMGKNVRKRRELLGMSQKELADVAMMRVDILDDFENGKTQLDFNDIIYIAKLLDTPVQNLLSLGIANGNNDKTSSADNDRWSHIANFFNVIGYKIERELSINEDNSNNSSEQKKELLTKYKVIARNSIILIDENDLEKILNRIVDTISFELWKIDSKEG